MLVLALVAAACTSGGDEGGGDDDDDGGVGGPSTTTTGTEVRESPSESTDATAGATGRLRLDLSDGSPAGLAGPSIDVVDGEPLGDDDATAVLDRLPEWDLPDDDRTDFERPAETLPPPRAGETIEADFPPSGPGPDRPAEPDGPLEVVRFQPEGDVDVAPFFTVTFNQPMVPLATLEELDEADVPVEVTPAIEGRWRWLGTRTLRFEVIPGDTDRLPAATEYAVEVPAGTTSADGAELAEAVSWNFTTPAPSVTTFVGESDSLSTEPVFVAVFDQLVDPDAVLGAITLEADGDGVGLRSASESEIEADDDARVAVDRALDDRWIAFTPTDPLPVDTRLDISIGPGVPSAEGPRMSEDADDFRARTFGAFEVARTNCGFDGACRPASPFVIELSNPIDADANIADLVTVDPVIPGLSVNSYGEVIELFGGTAGNTDYTVTLDGSLTDVFGQTLGDDVDVTFEVGPAESRLDGLRRSWITVDPMADTPSVPIFTVNHDSVQVTAWAVTPDQVDEFNDFHIAHYRDTDPPDPDWPVVLDTEIEVEGEQDRAVETAIDLSDAFAEAGSQIVVRVEPTREFGEPMYWQNRPTVAWVQDTTLGIDAFSDREELVIWTTDLTTGEPVGNVPVELIGDDRAVTTDENGLAHVALDDQGVRGLYADDGDRSAILSAGEEGAEWKSAPRAADSRWYVFDDRGIYRPGETVRMAGWVRRAVLAEGGRLEQHGGATVSYAAHDGQGNEIASGDVEINALGGFNLAFDVPDGANLGAGEVELRVDGADAEASTYHRIEIQEFRRPEFEVTTRAETPPPYLAAEPATVAVDAAYYAGGPLADSQVDWLVSTSETSYSPPDWRDYTFGVWTPWWQPDLGYDDGFYDYEGDIGPVGEVEYEEFSGRTDAAGTHLLEIGFRDREEDDDVDLPSTVTAEATVFDVNRQPLASRTELLVHAAEDYVGLRSDRPFVEQGTPMRIESVVTDIDGELVAGRDVEMTAGRIEWVHNAGQWTEEVVDPQHCTLTSTAATDPDARASDMTCEFATEVGGEYRITAIVTDDDGNRNRSELTIWVSGGAGRPSRDVEQQEVTIVPDRETYAPGDTAELLVQAPFAPASGSITTMHGGIESTATFAAEDGSAIVEVPVTDADVPNLTVHVTMNGTAERTADDGSPVPDAPPRPAYATGQVTLSVPPVTRALDVTVEPGAAELEPGDDTDVTVEVRSPDGELVDGADVAVVVVDEAVLALTDYELADPLDVFYAPFQDHLDARYARAAIQLTRPDLLGADGAGEMSTEGTMAAGTEAEGDDAAAGESMDAEESGAPFDEPAARQSAQDQIDVRENFDALAVFAPNESTGRDGTVTVDVPLPDSLTRYRVMAVAVDGATDFGTGESAITARLPLMVRPSAPRFLNFGDAFELPVVVQNQTDREMSVDVAVETSNLELTGPQGMRISVPADDRVEVRFPAESDEVGTARFRVAAASTDASLGHVDAAAGDLPVYTPATAEAFATYGTIDGNGDAATVGQPLSAPDGVIPQFGGLEINTSATALQALTDAVLYLADYPYESADGYASRIMAIAALRDVLEAFDADGLPEPGELDDQVARDIEGLTTLQNDDGGFPYWQRGRESVPWVSVQATHALVLADQAGYDVPDRRLERALEHLASIEQHIPDRYPRRLRNTLVAYAIHARGLSGDVDTAAAEAHYTDVGDELELDAVAWLWPSVADPELRADIELRITNAAVETAGAATFSTGYGEDAYLIAHSSRRTDGVVLDALISQTPDSDLIPKVVAGLLGGQTKGRWSNAHENAFILIALHEYFAAFESVTPDFVARTWLGDEYVFEHGFEGRTTERANTLVPMSELVAAGDTDLLVQNDGAGRLYYRLGLRYAPDDLVLDPRDEGFVVERTYEAVDDPADLTRDDDGTWHIKAGAAVRVRLTMVADARRTHVALVDPLPAGLEPVNPALAVSQTIAPEDGEDDGRASSWRGWWWNWFDHQNMRDDRVEAFSAHLPGGTYDYSYVARATTPGTFVTPPTKAEEIYAPETFGRSASAAVVVE